jgi:hypothetical protein
VYRIFGKLHALCLRADTAEVFSGADFKVKKAERKT